MLSNSQMRKYALLAAVSILGFAAVGTRADDATAPGSSDSSEASYQEGSTKPLYDGKLSFKYQGVIKSIAVQNGDVVKAGQVLANQDDEEDRIEYEADQKAANSTAEIDIALATVKEHEAEYRAKKTEYERVKKIQNEGGNNDSEVDKAQAEMEAAEQQIVEAQANVKKAEVEREQYRDRARQKKAHLDRLSLQSPVDGIVQKIDFETGEMVDPSKPSNIEVVRTDVLKVYFTLPAAQTEKLKLGETLQVSYDRKTWQDAKVTYLAPVAEAAAGGWRPIELQMQNSANEPAGRKITIKLPADALPANVAEATR